MGLLCVWWSILGYAEISWEVYPPLDFLDLLPPKSMLAFLVPMSSTGH